MRLHSMRMVQYGKTGKYAVIGFIFDILFSWFDT